MKSDRIYTEVVYLKRPEMKQETIYSAARSLDALNREIQTIKSHLGQLIREVEHAESCCQNIGAYINAVYRNHELSLNHTDSQDSSN